MPAPPGPPKSKEIHLNLHQPVSVYCALLFSIDFAISFHHKSYGCQLSENATYQFSGYFTFRHGISKNEFASTSVLRHIRYAHSRCQLDIYLSYICTFVALTTNFIPGRIVKMIFTYTNDE